MTGFRLCSAFRDAVELRKISAMSALPVGSCPFVASGGFPLVTGSAVNLWSPVALLKLLSPGEEKEEAAEMASLTAISKEIFFSGFHMPKCVNWPCPQQGSVSSPMFSFFPCSLLLCGTASSCMAFGRPLL